MRLSVVVIIKNEIDIINLFLNHIISLFDDIYLIDHSSIDGTSDVLKMAEKNYKKCRYVKAELTGFYQKEISKLIMHELFANGAEFVFFLDCDEFIQVSDRKELEKKLLQIKNPHEMAGSLRWVNGFPKTFDKKYFNYQSSIFLNPEISPYSKIIIPIDLYNAHHKQLNLTQGNHKILDEIGNPINILEIGTLLHIPIRSKKQLILKVIQSSISNLSRTNRKPREGFHYNEMLREIASSNISVEYIRGFVNLYQKQNKIFPINNKTLQSEKWQLTSLKKIKIAYHNRNKCFFIHRKKILFEKLIAEQLLNFGEEDPSKLVFIDGESTIKLKPNLQE